MVGSFQIENKYISDVFVKHNYMSDYQVAPDVGETKTIDRVRVSVNDSVEKCKNQLRFISEQLW